MSKAADESSAAETGSWRDLAVSRSLDSARTRAENRVQRFLTAALELMEEGDGKEFTVQQVVDRSGQSLRSFYQYFGGKHEVLLALFEESIRTTAEHLRERVTDQDDELERLHQFVLEYYRLCRRAPKVTKASKATKATRASGARKKAKKGASPVLVDFAQLLLTDHPNEAGQAFVPLVTLFEELLEAAADAGAIRADLDRAHVAGVVLGAVMFNAFSATIAVASVSPGAADVARDGEELWDLMVNGLASMALPSTRPSPVACSTTRR